MPYYDYRCQSCQKRVTFFYKTYKEFDQAIPVCTHCGGRELSRLIRRITIAKSENSRVDGLADEAMLGNLDENDPRSIGRFMRQMSEQTGEDLGEEFGEVVNRLEKGQTPDEIEQAMPGLAGAADSSPAGFGDDF